MRDVREREKERKRGRKRKMREKKKRSVMMNILLVKTTFNV